MFERFTDRSRRAVVLSQEYARLLNHNYIGVEHVLLGLLHEGEGVAARVLAGAGVTAEAVQAGIPPCDGNSPSGHIPFTPEAKKLCELALRESLALGHNYIGTEHLLLGLIRQGYPALEAIPDLRERVLVQLASYSPPKPAPVRLTPSEEIVSGVLRRMGQSREDAQRIAQEVCRALDV